MLKSLAQSTSAEPPAQTLPFALAMALVLQSLALAMELVLQSLALVLKSLARKPCPPADLFCWRLVQSTASAPRPQPSGAVILSCTDKPGKN